MKFAWLASLSGQRILFLCVFSLIFIALESEVHFKGDKVGVSESATVQFKDARVTAADGSPRDIEAHLRLVWFPVGQ